MVYDVTSKEFNHELKADKNYAQILIQISPHSKTLREAKKMIEDLGVNIVKTKSLSSEWILFKLDVLDMRTVALKLTEHGFFIKGINALTTKT